MDIKCQICEIFGIERVAEYMGKWDTGKDMPLCRSCEKSGNGKGNGRYRPVKLTTWERMNDIPGLVKGIEAAMVKPVNVTYGEMPDIDDALDAITDGCDVVREPVFLCPRYGVETYNVGTDVVQAFFRRINGVLYRFNRTTYRSGGRCIRVWREGRSKPVKIFGKVPVQNGEN